MEDNKLRIIQHAEVLFRQYGFKSITMDDIARQLGISKKTIYQYFSDKQEVVMAVLVKIFSEDEQRMEAISQEAADRIEEMVRISDYFRGMMRSMNPIIFHDMQRYYPKAWAHYQQHKQECYRGNLSKALRAGISEGYFREEIDVEVLSKMRLHQVELGFDQTVFPSHDYDLTHVQTQFFELFLHGLCTSKGYEKLKHYQSESNMQK